MSGLSTLVDGPSYEVWSADLDIVRRKLAGAAETEHDKLANPFQISQPTKPYTDMTFGMGKRGYPAICMTQHSCRTFCKWLSAKTGRYYRLPTEAEWEYACRAGTTTAFGSVHPEDVGWFGMSSGSSAPGVATKLPNAWGLYDMLGNVAEWTLDQYDSAYFTKITDGVTNPLTPPGSRYPKTVRGGG